LHVTILGVTLKVLVVRLPAIEVLVSVSCDKVAYYVGEVGKLLCDRELVVLADDASMKQRLGDWID
jgi:hypothetical protein